jgi:hypothetical protein
MGSGAFAIDKDFNFRDYVQTHIASSPWGPFGPDVYVYVFDTTRDQERAIADRIEAQPNGTFACAANSSAVLKGIGPFKKLQDASLPSNVKSQLDALVNKGEGTRQTGQEYLINYTSDPGHTGQPKE